MPFDVYNIVLKDFLRFSFRFSKDFLLEEQSLKMDRRTTKRHEREERRKTKSNLLKIYADAKGIIKNSCFSCFSMFPDYLMFFF